MKYLTQYRPVLKLIWISSTFLAASGCALTHSASSQAAAEIRATPNHNQPTERVDRTTAKRLFDEASDGDAAAQYALAQQLLLSVPGDSGRRSALNWMRRANLGGHPAAVRWMLIYHLKYGSTQEQAVAHQQLLATSAIDEAERQLLLGTNWWLGRGAAVDHSRALAAWQRAGSLGNLEALYNLVLAPLHNPEITLDQRLVYDQLGNAMHESTAQIPAEVLSALPHLTDWLGSEEYF